LALKVRVWHIHRQSLSVCSDHDAPLRQPAAHISVVSADGVEDF
jgi:hypothetical protein